MVKRILRLTDSVAELSGIPSKAIRCLMSGFSASERARRKLLMLQTYVDDSGVGQHPVCVLAGWFADSSTWELFSEEWDMILRMSPRIRYFKFVEATTFSGEFYGMTKESRAEKMQLLVNCLIDHQLKAVKRVMHYDAFYEYIAPSANPLAINPYIMLFWQMIRRVHKQYDWIESIDFIFDQQFDRMENVIDLWKYLRDNLSEQDRKLIKLPLFRDDKDVLPLQAADLLAGWTRQKEAAVISGNVPLPLWDNRHDDKEMTAIDWLLNWKIGAAMYHQEHGFFRPKFTYSFGSAPRQGRLKF